MEEIEYPVVKVNELEYCKIAVSYIGDPDIIKEKRTEAVAELRKVQIPGFRKGKAPDYAIKARCKTQIDNWVAREMSTQAFDDMIFETGVKPFGMPKFTDISCKKGKYSCEMIVEHQPSFELEDYGSIEIEPDTEVNIEQKVQEGLISLRKRAGQIAPYGEDDSVEIGDEVTMSFTATIDNESFDGSIVEGEMYTVGSNKFPTFDDYIIGMKADEERDFSLVFPEEVPSIGGKTAEFKVKVHMGTKKVPAELNEEFFKTCGVTDYDELSIQLNSIIKGQVKQAQMQKVHSQITTKLVEMHDFAVPDFQIEKEAKMQTSNRGLKWDSLDEKSKKLLSDMSLESVKLSLILESIREEEPDSVLSDAEAQNQLLHRVANQGQDPRKFLAESRGNGRLLSLVAQLRDEFTLQWIIDQVTNKEENNGKTETEEVNKS